MPAKRKTEKKNGEKAEPTKKKGGNGNNGETTQFRAKVLEWFKQNQNRWVKSSTVVKGLGLTPSSSTRTRVRKACKFLEKQGSILSKREKHNYQYAFGTPEETVAEEPAAEPEEKVEPAKTEKTKKAKPKQEKANPAKKAEASEVAPHILTTANELRKNRRNQKPHPIKLSEKVPNPWSQ